jgi:hypothetical protein
MEAECIKANPKGVAFASEGVSRCRARAGTGRRISISAPAPRFARFDPSHLGLTYCASFGKAESASSSSSGFTVSSVMIC